MLTPKAARSFFISRMVFGEPFVSAGPGSRLRPIVNLTASGGPYSRQQRQSSRQLLGHWYRRRCHHSAVATAVANCSANISGPRLRPRPLWKIVFPVDTRHRFSGTAKSWISRSLSEDFRPRRLAPSGPFAFQKRGVCISIAGLFRQTTNNSDLSIRCKG